MCLNRSDDEVEALCIDHSRKGIFRGCNDSTISIAIRWFYTKIRTHMFTQCGNITQKLFLIHDS